MAAAAANQSQLLALPSELRNRIYEHVSDRDAAEITILEFIIKGKCSKQPGYLFANRQLCREARAMYVSKNRKSRKILVRIGRKKGMPKQAMASLGHLVNFINAAGTQPHIIIQLGKLQWADIHHVMPIAMFIHEHGAGSIYHSTYDAKRPAVVDKDFNYHGYRVEFRSPAATGRLNCAIVDLMERADEAKTRGASAPATKRQLETCIKAHFTTGYGQSRTAHLVPQPSGLYFLGPRPTPAPIPAATPLASTQHTSMPTHTPSGTSTSLTTGNSDPDHSSSVFTPPPTLQTTDTVMMPGYKSDFTPFSTRPAFHLDDSFPPFPFSQGLIPQAHGLPAYTGSTALPETQPTMLDLQASGMGTDAAMLSPDFIAEMSVLQMEAYNMALYTAE